MEDLLTHYRQVVEGVAAAARAANREPASVRLIAVSKTKPFAMIETLYRAGQRDFGENYAQELSEKAALAEIAGLHEIRWHFLGHLQSNKVKMLLPHVFLIHAIDSAKLLREIEKRADRVIDCLIEVKIDPEDSKSGVYPGDVPELLTFAASMAKSRIRGIMGIPDPDRKGGPAEAFSALAEIAEKYGLPEKSMGMTADFQDAIAAGSTYVRVGTAIFGSRG